MFLLCERLLRRMRSVYTHARLQQLIERFHAATSTAGTGKRFQTFRHCAEVRMHIAWLDSITTSSEVTGCLWRPHPFFTIAAHGKLQSTMTGVLSSHDGISVLRSSPCVLYVHTLAELLNILGTIVRRHSRPQQQYGFQPLKEPRQCLVHVMPSCFKKLWAYTIEQG